MAAEEADLELLGQLFGDRARDEAAEARVDTVGVLLCAMDGAPNQVARGAHLLTRGVRESDLGAIDCHRPDVGETEVVSRESLALDHEPSLSRSSRPAWSRSRVL